MLVRSIRGDYLHLSKGYRQYRIGTVATALTLTTVNHQTGKGNKMDDISILKELLEIMFGNEEPKQKTKKKRPRDSRGRFIKREITW